MQVPAMMHFRPEGANSHHATHLQQLGPILPLQPPHTNLPGSEEDFHIPRTSAQAQSVATKISSDHSQSITAQSSSGHSQSSATKSSSSGHATIRTPNTNSGTAVVQSFAAKNSASHATIGRANTISHSIHLAKRKQAASVTDYSSSHEETSTAHTIEPVTMVTDALHPASGPPEKRPRPQEITSQLSSIGCQTEPLFQDGTLEEEEVTRASSAELPVGLGYVEMIGQCNKRLGVMVIQDMEAGQEFGPFTGEFVKEGMGSANPSTWEICVRGKTRFYINGASDPNNWMTLVQVARCKEEQNLEAFQFYGDIFFRTTKQIKSGTELRVFYSTDYRKRVGFRSDLDELKLDQGSKRFECRDCKCHYTNAKSLLRHFKFEHDKENRPKSLNMEEASEGCKDSNVARRLEVENKVENVTGAKSTQIQRKFGQENKHRKPLLHKKSKPNNSLKQLQVKFVSPRKTKGSDSVKKRSKVVQRFVCDICQKPFPSEGHLKAHMAFHVEANVSKHVCSTCGLECRNTRILNQHMISHDPNAFRCHICKKYFRRKGRIVSHLRHEHNLFVGKKWARADLNDLLNKQQDPGDGDAKQKEEDRDNMGIKEKPTCGECSQEFEDLESLEQHASSHRSGGFKCQYCSKKFQLNSHLIAHFRKDHKIFLWNKHSLKKNMEERLARLILPSEQQEEMSQFHPELPQDMLGKRIVQELKLPKYFKCKYCPKTYTNFGRVIRHEKEAHTNTGEFMCEFCSALFVKETQYILHKRRHTNDRPFKCEQCPLSFGCESAREKHMAQHTGECPFKCDVCGKGYRSRKYMQTHRRKVHQPPKVLYPCSFCSRQFKDKGARKKHENCHKGIRPYVCLTCGKAFGNANTLKCHTLIHTGEKPFVCEQCGKRFRLSHQLNIHTVIHDKAKKQEIEKREIGCGSNQ